jgi:hypothetical protein
VTFDSTPEMSLAITHFAFGALMITIILTLLWPTVRYPRTLVLLGGGWGMAPDFHWVSPIAEQQFHQFHQSVQWTDIFWLHRTWDRIDPTDSKSVGAVLFASLIVATAIAEHRNYQTPTFVKSVFDTDSDSRSAD